MYSPFIEFPILNVFKKALITLLTKLPIKKFSVHTLSLSSFVLLEISFLLSITSSFTLVIE